jgi:putative transposase
MPTCARWHAGRDPTPSAAIIESQSVETPAGGTRGVDGAKIIAGRQRHILVDTQGHLLVAIVDAANLLDRDGGRLVREAVGTAFPRLQRIWADQGDTGPIRRGAADRYGLTLDVVYPFGRRLQRYTPEVLAQLG